MIILKDDDFVAIVGKPSCAKTALIEVLKRDNHDKDIVCVKIKRPDDAVAVRRMAKTSYVPVIIDIDDIGLFGDSNWLYRAADYIIRVDCDIHFAGLGGKEAAVVSISGKGMDDKMVFEFD